MPQYGSRRHALLPQQIVSQGQRRTKQLATAGSPILRERDGCGENQVGFRDEVFKRVQFSSVRWLCHTSMVRLCGAESKRSLFFIQRNFQALPGVADSASIGFLRAPEQYSSSAG